MQMEFSNSFAGTTRGLEIVFYRCSAKDNEKICLLPGGKVYFCGIDMRTFLKKMRLGWMRLQEQGCYLRSWATRYIPDMSITFCVKDPKLLFLSKLWKYSQTFSGLRTRFLLRGINAYSHDDFNTYGVNRECERFKFCDLLRDHFKSSSLYAGKNRQKTMG